MAVSERMAQTGGSQTRARRRRDLIAATLDRVRAVEARGDVTRAALEEIKRALLDMAAESDLFPEEDFPMEGPGGTLYLLSEDPDHRLALYLATHPPGNESPPHDHTTWAVICGLAGREENRLYRRTPGAGLEETGRFTVEAGSGIAFLGEDIHSIHIVSEGRTRNFHMYGMSLEHLPARRRYDPGTGDPSPFPAFPHIVK